ncbi:MAG: aminopeptidase P N-terminal domain-containing protein [Myxococcota bacterium]|nr:aminopeptidase P N-terminal domain-containing protein [Myxococcota bacterium]
MFEQRRKRLLEAMGPDAVAILQGARCATRSNDTEFRFRQDSDFWYLSGFDHPDAVAVMRTDGGPAYTLFVQPRNPEAEVWTGFRPGVEGAKDDYGADEAFAIDELHQRLPELLAKAKRLHHQFGRDPKLDAAAIETLDAMRRRSRQGAIPPSQIIDPREILHEMRLFKSAHELELMRRAAAISHEAHAEAAKLAHEGHHEYELEAVLDYTYRRRGGWGPAYGTIVAGGSNATVLHYITNDQPLRNGDLVLIDSGAEFQGYASDVTRTYPVGGRFASSHRAVYEAVLEAQLAGLALCQPGKTLQDVHVATTRRLVEGMVSLGLVSGTVDDIMEQQSYRPFYMHSTSHWLGLDVHDVGYYSHDEVPRQLEPGMAFTVEPGIYISKDAKAAPEHLRGIGVRIEDDVVISDAGHENLNAAIPKRVDEIEAWVSS